MRRTVFLLATLACFTAIEEDGRPRLVFENETGSEIVTIYVTPAPGGASWERVAHLNPGESRTVWLTQYGEWMVRVTFFASRQAEFVDRFMVHECLRAQILANYDVVVLLPCL